MDWILDRLALGDRADGESATPAQVHVCLNIAEATYVPKPGMTLLHMPVPDEVRLSAPVWAYLLVQMTAFLHRGQRVLVHCRLGKSRSPALVCAYLIQCGYAPTIALALATSCRKEVAIHPETWASVLDWQRGLYP